jgi:acyl carrier protein
MLPASFVGLESFPLTSNGKIDRQALPAPDRMEIHGEVGYVEPRKPVEEALTQIWREVLKRERIGIHDNLFSDLAGHSLLATQLVSRIRYTFAIDFPLQRIFEKPTIAELAEVIEELLIADIAAAQEPTARSTDG